jgi:hypothetical protein
MRGRSPASFPRRVLDPSLHSRSSLDALRIQLCTGEADRCFRDSRGIYLAL